MGRIFPISLDRIYSFRVEIVEDDSKSKESVLVNIDDRMNAARRAFLDSIEDPNSREYHTLLLYGIPQNW